MLHKCLACEALAYCYILFNILMFCFQCESLLKTLGVRCVKGSGEAEATCAQLNAQGVCIYLFTLIKDQVI